MRIRYFLMGMSCVLLLGCASTPVSPNAVVLGVDFQWQSADRCASRSPEIRVTNLPAETKLLRVRLKDLDVPNWNHGGGEVAYTGKGVIPAGALQGGYNGPCPPSGSHRYQFTVQALNAQGVVVGSGKQMRTFP